MASSLLGRFLLVTFVDQPRLSAHSCCSLIPSTTSHFVPLCSALPRRHTFSPCHILCAKKPCILLPCSHNSQPSSFHYVFSFLQFGGGNGSGYIKKNNGHGGDDGDDDDDGNGGIQVDSKGWQLFPLLLFFYSHKLVSIHSVPCIHERNRITWLVSFSFIVYIWQCRVLTAFAKVLHLPSKFIWEVKGGKWTKIVSDASDDAFMVDMQRASLKSLGWKSSCWWVQQCNHLFLQLMLPEGFPQSVSSDYLEYSIWRGVQGVASQINGVLTTQALLYAIGLGKGAIPTAAAVNWVLKDGIGYLSKILLSKYGRHFDVNPKGWRLCADLLENMAYGMELLTPTFPHLFVLIGAVAGASRSAAALIQAATRSCFYAGFATQRNFAEVIAKGEAQGMVSKSIGVMLGIVVANSIGSSVRLAIVAFSLASGLHMYCNLKSYQSVQLRTLNPYRASLVFSEYLLTGQVPSIEEVNKEEPLFSGLLPVNMVSQKVLSADPKHVAAQISSRLRFGIRLSDVVSNDDDANALFDLFSDEGYMLTEYRRNFCVILKEGSSPEDMLKSLFQVNYLYWLEMNAGIESQGVINDCRTGGRLQISLDYVQREFNHVKEDGQSVGWLTQGLIARPLPNRIHSIYASA